MMATGIGAFIWVGRRPNKKDAPAKKRTYREAMAPHGAWTTNAGPSTTPRNLPMLNTSPLFRGNPEYRQDIEDLNYESVMDGGYTEIASSTGLTGWLKIFRGPGHHISGYEINEI